eukprot:1186809-Prorocentrum_minimum.AAC.7
MADAVALPVIVKEDECGGRRLWSPSGGPCPWGISAAPGVTIVLRRRVRQGAWSNDSITPKGLSKSPGADCVTAAGPFLRASIALQQQLSRDVRLTSVQHLL